MKLKICCVVTVLVVSCWYIAPTNALYSAAPQITPNQTNITVKAGQNYQFSCESNVPITFKFDDYIRRAYAEANNNKTFNPNITHTLAASNRYRCQIELTAIDYSFVGFYYCVKNSSGDFDYSYLLSNEQASASRIYLFVEDPQHPIVLGDTIILRGEANFVIPCKPTSVSNNSAKVELRPKNNCRDEFEYNDYNGYILKHKNACKTESFICRSNNTTRTYLTADIDYLRIVDDHPDLVVNGTLVLDCMLDTTDGPIHNLNITWTTPNFSRAQMENRANTTIDPWQSSDLWPTEQTNGTHLKHTLNSKLIVNKFDENFDLGSYECSINIGSKTIDQTRFHVQKDHGDGATGEAIIGDGIYLHINDTLQYDWTLTEGDKIEWRVFFEGRPQPEITWLDPRGERIAWYQPKNKTTNLIAQLKSTITSLIVRNVSCDQVGEYILQASNGHFTKQTKFRLAVQPKPTVLFMAPGIEYKFGFKISDDPNLQCYFASCNSSVSCGSEQPLIAERKPDGQTPVAWAKITPAQSGFVTCPNNQCTEQRTTNIVVSDLKEKMVILDQNVKEQSISVTCTASNFFYFDQVDWYKDDLLIRNSKGARLTRENTKYGYRTKLTWENPPFGKYICRAMALNGGYDEKSFWLNQTSSGTDSKNKTNDSNANANTATAPSTHGNTEPHKSHWMKIVILLTLFASISIVGFVYREKVYFVYRKILCNYRRLI